MSTPHISDLPVGAPVRYWTGERRGEGKTSRTRTKVSMLGGHTPVVWVDGEASCIALSHIEPIERCPHCDGTGIEPGSKDYDYAVHMYNPYTGEPCTACQRGVR